MDCSCGNNPKDEEMNSILEKYSKDKSNLIQILNELTINIVEQPESNIDQETKEGTVVYTDTLTGDEIKNLQQAGTKEIKYENLKSNTTYTIEITGNVQLGNTQEEVPITYNYKEFTTLKNPAKVEIRNQFVTGNLIDFDVRIEDIDNSVLNNTVRMELREENNNLIDIPDYEVFSDKALLDTLRNKIVQSAIDNNIPNNKNLNTYINEEIDKTLEGYDLSSLERNHIFNLIENEINGYGPLTELLDDPNITEIMVNGPSEIYIELDGKIIKDDTVSFINEEHILRTIQRMIQPLGRTIDLSTPMVDSRLKDGSRINAVIPPLSLNGPIITIRKFKRNLNNIEDLIRNGTLTPYMARFLDACVKAKLNILVCGGTGSGKTTILNVLSSFINDDERIITIEDAAELKLKQEHVITLETRNTNYEQEKEITIRDLVINALRMRPDRIIVGEVRGKEAFDMLQAMNTGHDGSMSTLHANGPRDALNRLETMVLMGGIEIPVLAVREYILNAINIVVNVERLSDGKRKITSICEVTGFKDNEIKLKEIFAFKQKGLTANKEVNGSFILYKYIPKVYEIIKSKGINLVDDIFNEIENK